MSYRIGFGYDSHQLIPHLDATLMLGNVAIKTEWAVVARSDGDVLLHAFADAILGAVGLGDLGQYFPEKDPATAGLESTTILQTAIDLARQAGWTLSNVDLTIVCERVMIGPHRAAINHRLQALTGCAAINVKAKRFEAERNEIRCYVSALLTKEKSHA